MNRTMCAAAVTALLALAACGGGDGVDPEADAAAAERAIDALIDELEDDGFVEDDDEDDDELEPQSEECEELIDALGGGDEGLPDETAKEESGGFTTGELTEQGGGELTVEATVGFSEDAGAIEDLFEVLASDEVGDCVIEAFEAGIAQNAEEDDLDIELAGLEFDEIDAPSVGDETFGFRIEGDFAFGGLEFPFGSEVLFARDGRLAVEVSATTVGGDAPDVDLDDLLELLVDEATAS